MNKPAKSFLEKQFEMWYSDQVTQQLKGQDIETVAVEPGDLSMGMMKEIGAKWLVDMAHYIGDNPQFIVNGFIHASIAKALNGEDIDDSSASEAIATTIPEESDDDDDKDNTHIDFIVLIYFESVKYVSTSDLFEYHVYMYNYIESFYNMNNTFFDYDYVFNTDLCASTSFNLAISLCNKELEPTRNV